MTEWSRDESQGGPALIGRTSPLRAISSLLDRAHDGKGGALALSGVPGVGKTALIRHTAGLAERRGFDVRIATGVPVEADLPFAILGSLLAPELRRGLPADAFPVLRAALGISPMDSPPSALAVAAEVLELLSRAGRSSPLFVVIDDVQWADRSSIAVIGHVARHVVADRVAVLLAHRPSSDAPYGVSLEQSIDAARHRAIEGVDTLHVETLTEHESIAALVEAGCSPMQAARWALHCGGLPLAIAEVGRRSGHAGLDPTDIALLLPDVYRQQIAELPPEVVAAALCAAVCSDVAILAGLGRPSLRNALRQAETFGLVTFAVDARSHESHVAFRHPLLRAAVLLAASRADERAVHRAVAMSCVEAGLHDRAAVHLSFGADGTDDVAAEAIGLLGDRAHGRGALVEAANAWMRSAALHSRQELRSALFIRAADAMFDHGDAAGAFRTLEDALRYATNPHDEADARSLQSRISTWSTSPKDAVRGLVRVATAMRTIDPSRAATALAAASTNGYLDGDLAAAIDRGRDAERLATDNNDMVSAATASAALAWNTFMIGEWEEYDRRIGPLEPLMRILLEQKSWAGVHLAELFATTWVCAERWDDAEPLIRTLLSTTRAMGARLSAASTSLLLASLCWRRGRWDEAYALSATLLDDSDSPPITLAWMRILTAQLFATMGRVDETRELLGLGLPVAVAADVPLIVAMGNASLGHLELSLGHDEKALAHLDRVAVLTARMGFREPEYFPWQSDYLDALVRVGRHDEAAEVVRQLSKLGEEGNRRWVRGVVARTLGQLADGHDAANAHFENALSHFESLGMPFEVARTLLMRGRPQDKADARRLFLRLGASVWAERASRRNGTTETVHTDDTRTAAEAPRVLELLAPQERAVALAVVSGRTSRQIAAELHLSVKTVDHYLQSAYRRLGVKNRTELATTVAGALAAPRRT